MRFWKVDLALIILVAFGLGIATIQGRGGNADESHQFFARSSRGFEGFPEHFGTWRMVEDEPLTERTLSILQCDHHVNRSYVEDETGARILMTVLLGPAGPLVAHSPEVCLPSAQFDTVSPSEPIEVTTADGKKLTLLRGTFKSRDLSQQILHMYYAWVRPDGSWVAPQNPRWVLGGEVGLWKLQFATFTHGIPDNLEQWEEDEAQDEEVEPDVDAVEQFLAEHGGAIRDLLAKSSTRNVQEAPQPSNE